MLRGSDSRHHEFNAAARRRLADDATNAAGLRGARAHVRKAVPLPIQGLRVKPATVILNRHDHLLFAPMDPQAHFAGARVPHGVVQRLLDTEKDIPPHAKVAREVGQLLLDVKAAANRRRLEKRLGVFAQVGGEITKGVALRIDQPDDVLHVH